MHILQVPTEVDVMENSVLEASIACKRRKRGVVRTTLVKRGFASVATEKQDRVATT